MLSFYGGRRGASFTIERTYDTMPASISDINIGSYFLVRQDALHGYNSIYKKVVTSPGYEFIANLVQSPSSSQSGQEENPPIIWETYTAVEGHSGDSTYSSCTYTPADMVSGQTSSLIKFNSYQDLTGENHIGLQLPYPVINFTAEVKPASQITNTVEKLDTSTAFCSNFKLNIVESSSFKNLRVLQPKDVPVGTSIYDPVTDTVMTFSDPNEHIVVYDQVSANGTKIYYFGSWNAIEDIDLSQTGLLTITDINGVDYTYQFKDIDDISFENDVFTIDYKDGTSFVTQIRTVTDLEYDDITSQVIATYNTLDAETQQPEQRVLYTPNYIKNVKVTNDSHLWIYYSDPAYREEYGDPDEEYWVDYGSVTAASGILIGLNYTYEDLELLTSVRPITREVIIQVLQQEWPQGCGIGHGDLVVRYLTDDDGNYITDDQGYPIVVRIYDNITELNQNTLGKVITIGNANDNKEFYAFDYRINEWYYVGTINDEIEATPNIIIAPVDDSISGTQAILDELPIGGIWIGLEGGNV